MSGVPRDFLLAALLILAANFLLCEGTKSQLRSDSRRFSHRLMLAEIEAMPNDPLDLVIFGDSRGRQIDADVLCDHLFAPPPRRCANVSSVAGDWVTADLHFRELGSRITEDTIVLVLLSDYWLEMGGLERGLLRNTTAYVSLGQPANAVASFFPLSQARGLWMGALHRQLRRKGWALLMTFTDDTPPPSIDAQREAEIPEIAGWSKSHVDQWFSPISERDRATRKETARRVLQQLTAGGRRLALVDLSKHELRNRYVDRYYPGRRARYQETVDDLRRDFGVPFLDLDGQFTSWSAYRDFHHFTDAVLPFVHQRVAARLRALPGFGFKRKPAG